MRLSLGLTKCNARYDRVRCPSAQDVLKTPMTLLSVTFQTKREFLVNGENKLTVSDTKDQDSQVRSRQVTVCPYIQLLVVTCVPTISAFSANTVMLLLLSSYGQLIQLHASGQKTLYATGIHF
jgi:hypothetical protein